MPSVNIYTKEQVDTLLAGTGGKTITDITTYAELRNALVNASVGDMLVGKFVGKSNDYAQNVVLIATNIINETLGAQFIASSMYYIHGSTYYRNGMLGMYAMQNGIRIDYQTSISADNQAVISSTDTMNLDQVKWVHFN